MLVHDYNQRQAWKKRVYPVPNPTRSGFRWRASALRRLNQWSGRTAGQHPATIVVPALYNLMPAESLAMGWLSEIETLLLIRQRMTCAASVTGWDVFTFHTQHNADQFYDSTIGALRDTWMKEGNLSSQALLETRRQFGKPWDYHRVHARLVENLVFQSSLMDWLSNRASDVPLQFHVIGTALLSALVSAGSISFKAAVTTALKFGKRWDDALRKADGNSSEDEAGWNEFTRVRKLVEGRAAISMPVEREDLPKTDAPCRPFWYAPSATDEPLLITTAQDAACALETMNLGSWAACTSVARSADETIRGWLVSPLHHMARQCKWSMTDYLLATPGAAELFLDHIAPLGRGPMLQLPVEPLQNRFRLSRMKVTGP